MQWMLYGMLSVLAHALQIGNAGVRYNDPQENVIPGQVAGSNFPGQGVSCLPLCPCS